MARLKTLLQSERTNALVGWFLTLVIVVAALDSLLTAAVLWGCFGLLVAAVIALPAVAVRDWAILVPWPLPLVAALGVVLKAVGPYPELAEFVALSTFALVTVVNLDLFTSVDMSRRFARGFAVLAAMAAEALWVVAQYYSDRWLGTAYLTSVTELQWDFVAVTVVALAVGGFFAWCLPRFEHAGFQDRQPARRESV